MAIYCVAAEYKLDIFYTLAILLILQDDFDSSPNVHNQKHFNTLAIMGRTRNVIYDNLYLK